MAVEMVVEVVVEWWWNDSRVVNGDGMVVEMVEWWCNAVGMVLEWWRSDG